MEPLGVIRTEAEFTLPDGFLDSDGNIHKNGIMRRATAADEVLPLKDPRVQKNPAYLVVILLSRVVTRLGELDESEITPKVIEGLFTRDLAYLQDFYNEFNGLENGHREIICPECQHSFELEEPRSGEFLATPSIS